jgi:hypothetical protein
MREAEHLLRAVPLLVIGLALSVAGCVPASDFISFSSPEMGFEVSYPAAWGEASGASLPTSYGICAGLPQPCRIASFLRIENQYFVSMQSWPAAGQTPADRSAQMSYLGEVEHQRTVGGEPAVERVAVDGGRNIWVAHDGWMYWLYFPAPSFRPERRGLARQFDAFIASARFVPVAPTPTPTVTPTPIPPATPAPTPSCNPTRMASRTSRR